MTPNKHVGSNWLHRKSGKKVVIIGHGKLEHNARPCFFYNEDGDEVIWARDQEEFLDGRFEQLAYQVAVFCDQSIVIALVQTSTKISDVVKELPGAFRVTDQEGTELWAKKAAVQ